MILTKFGNTLVAVVVLAVLTLLAVVVINGAKSSECESLYNEFSNTTNQAQRATLFQTGIDNGCFHYN